MKQDFILTRIKSCFSVCGELAKIDRFVRNFVLTTDGTMRVQGGEISRTLLLLNSNSVDCCAFSIRKKDAKWCLGERIRTLNE